ncbi:pleckstrin homology domain-containing family A member 5-like isoform X2 [Hippocampus comes]|uniref:pleckstrin homology domain-containing family A member 5-like isoform X2 n=1 Tax=Hippocampus comes TaxID=109280 RepID=UPI00094E68A8|nr:PREDICTED: pleckstrin homology domain-containing family A member 5-like isoform X2 [Hippocampus comes]
MAADLQPEWISGLPSSWSYGLTRDGRVFFVNEEAKSTTWLHPLSGEAVITGHRKTPDLPIGWEEGYTFEGARCFINHNERKVTCKHPVSGSPSQDNCIFVINEQSAGKVPVNEKKEQPRSIMSEASNNTGGSDCAANQSGAAARASRPPKKLHNFGKRSNSIRRNPSAPVIKRDWLYKQDSTGMKLWKKRWFVLSDLCLFYYRGESFQRNASFNATACSNCTLHALLKPCPGLLLFSWTQSLCLYKIQRDCWNGYVRNMAWIMPSKHGFDKRS